jgi:hypothetical protein
MTTYAGPERRSKHVEDVSHKEIYERLVTVEAKVDDLHADTRGVVAAFQAASGAFTVLDWIGKAAKPILFIAALAGAAGAWWSHLKEKM